MPIDIGSQAPNFDLPATDGSRYSYADVAGERATLIVFACNHCPYVVAYEPRLFDIARTHGPKGLGVAMINSNNEQTHPTDSFDAMVERVREVGHPCPYLRDESQDVARAYQAARTPEVFLFDASGSLVYQGGIDDSPDDASAAQVHGLRDAVEAVLAGGMPPRDSMPPKGCTIKWK